jgi:endonuclease III
MDKIAVLLETFPLYSEDLGIELTKPSGRFKWFLASMLFGARISEQIAATTYKAFELYGIDSPEKIRAAGWDELVRILDEGGYVRYDFSTATRLLEIMQALTERYGTLEALYEESTDTKELEKRLQEFKGVGTVTTQIFLRELRGVWAIRLEVSNKAAGVAKKLEIDPQEFAGDELARLETALVKLALRYCKRKRCAECPVRQFCVDRSRS